MEPIKKSAEKFSKSITWKGMIIGFITLLLLIPGAMIQELIQERKQRSEISIENINNLWSNDQTINGPVLTIPYEILVKYEDKSEKFERHQLTFAPENLIINGKIIPHEKHLGIYKSILYNSQLQITGNFPKVDFSKITYSRILWDEAKIRIGISDLRGVTSIPDFILADKHLSAEAGGSAEDVIGQGLIIETDFLTEENTNAGMKFSCELDLKGSSSLNFTPIGKNTEVKLGGNWNAPGFTGSFSPDHQISEKDFNAIWKVLHFNRNIPDKWIDQNAGSFENAVFGVKLVDMVNHYQQTERSAKYALMFIALTFVVFFFVEIFTGKKIHPIQYVLVGLALILFYSLLLSVSEQLGFGIAYLLASAAVIGMISLYTGSVFKSMKQSGLLALILTILYGYLYVVIQIEDVALLIGSIGLFIILGIIMFVSGKINWYKKEE